MIRTRDKGKDANRGATQQSSTRDDHSLTTTLGREIVVVNGMLRSRKHKPFLALMASRKSHQAHFRLLAKLEPICEFAVGDLEFLDQDLVQIFKNNFFVYF